MDFTPTQAWDEQHSQQAWDMGNTENPCVLPWKNGLCSEQAWIVHGATGGAQGTCKQAFRNLLMAPREKAGQTLRAQSGGRGTVTAARTRGCFTVSVWSKAVIKLPL